MNTSDQAFFSSFEKIAEFDWGAALGSGALGGGLLGGGVGAATAKKGGGTGAFLGGLGGGTAGALGAGMLTRKARPETRLAAMLLGSALGGGAGAGFGSSAWRNK